MYVTYGLGLGMSVFTPITGVDHLSIRQYILYLRNVTLVFVDFCRIVTIFGRIFAI